jgi:hypothetical protein
MIRPVSITGWFRGALFWLRSLTLGVRSTAQLFPTVLRVLRGNGMQDTSHKTRRRI